MASAGDVVVRPTICRRNSTTHARFARALVSVDTVMIDRALWAGLCDGLELNIFFRWLVATPNLRGGVGDQ